MKPQNFQLMVRAQCAVDRSDACGCDGELSAGSMEIEFNFCAKTALDVQIYVCYGTSLFWVCYDESSGDYVDC